MENQQYHFVVSPMSQRISLKAGETYTGSITVANPKSATVDFSFKISLSPYSVIDNDYTRDFTTVSDWSKIMEWTTIDTTEGTLKPNEAKEISFKIEVPKDAPAGGQYLAINVTSNQDTNVDAGGLIKDTYEMASLVYADIDGETKHEGQILNNSIAGFVAVGTPTTSVAVSNFGNVHEVLTTTLAIKNLITGQELLPAGETDGNYENIIMPNTTRELTHELSDVPVLGIFEVKQEVSYLDQISEVSTVMVVCPIWFILLIIATIASIISMVFYAKRLKKKRMQQKDTNV